MTALALVKIQRIIESCKTSAQCDLVCKWIDRLNGDRLDADLISMRAKASFKSAELFQNELWNNKRSL